MPEIQPVYTWVVEATLDVPVQLQADREQAIAALCVSLGGDDPDGFVEMRPVDSVRATSSVFWSVQEPIVYECRGLVRASNAGLALLRGKELYEHLADRLTLFTGYPVRVLAVGFTYNEDMLKQCVGGERTEYDATTGGQESFRTQPPKNARHQRLVMPPEAALEAIRWLRRAMSATTRVEEYLFLYIALESIAKHVPGVTRGVRRDAEGVETDGLESQESAAIKHLLARHPNLPPTARKTLATIRGRIAHGSADLETLELARANRPVLQRLVLDGIALVYGIEPAELNALAPSPIMLLAPLGRAQYTVDDHPARRWGGLLTESFARYAEAARRAVIENPESPPPNQRLHPTAGVES